MPCWQGMPAACTDLTSSLAAVALSVCLSACLPACLSVCLSEASRLRELTHATQTCAHGQALKGRA